MDPEAAAALAAYDRLMADPALRRFAAGGGRVFLATEGRSRALVAALIAAGHRHFAEKFVQEAARKWPPAERAPDVVLHDYGHLQTNKLAAALGLFDAIESVGRAALVEALGRRSGNQAPGEARGRVRSLFVQVNCGREPQKSGYAPEAAGPAVARMRALGLPVAGVMAIPPRDDDPEPHFRWLRGFADRHRLEHCIMGMSRDYALAIRCGATAVRIGTAVFGPKPPRPAAPLGAAAAVPVSAGSG